MTPAEITTLITSIIMGIAKVTDVTREALAKSLEDMARDVRSGSLIPDQLLSEVMSDSEKLKDIRKNLR